MATLQFHLGEAAYSLVLDLPEGLRQQFANAPRTYRYTGSLPRDWKVDYFRMWLQHPADQSMIRDLLSAMRAVSPGSDTDSLALCAIACVQSSVEYDFQAAYHLGTTHIRYPSETLLDGKGVCADKTILLAALLQALGYGLAILTWDRANHMALGLRVPKGYGNFGTPYAMVETTAPAAVGQVPGQYMGGIRLDGRPEVTELPGGTAEYRAIVAQRQQEGEMERQYGKHYLAMPPAQQTLHRQMLPLKAEIDTLAQQLKACKGTLPAARYAECQALQARHTAKVETYNDLVARFNAAGK